MSINLDEIEKAEREAETRPWKVEDDPEKFGENWLIAEMGYGGDARDGRGGDVWITTDRVHASECRSLGAHHDATFIVLLRNNANELLRLARIGQATERKEKQ